MLSDQEKDLARKRYSELLEKQSVLGLIISSVVSVLPALFVFYMLANSGRIPLLLLMLPGVIIGLGAKIGGMAISFKYRLIPAGISGVTMIVAGVLFGFYAPMFMFALPNAIVAGVLAKPKLTKQELEAVYRIEKGLVEL